MSAHRNKTSVLFLCTGNSCRSQMAEGWARTLHDRRIVAHSAGLEPKRLDPRAVAAMAEVGVDISNQRSKHLDELDAEAFDLVITVCGDVNERCPVFPVPVRRVLHAGFDDPPRLAADASSEDEAMQHYRRVRDEIHRFVQSLPDLLNRK